VERSLAYTRYVLDESQFNPLSFRAGNWLFQPTQDAASVLAQNGIRIDSSVFKGGLQHTHGLDYRRALRNGYYWSFDSDVNEPHPLGSWIEVPIYTEMVPFWRMLTAKRVALSRGRATGGQMGRQKPNRVRDFLRFGYPLKLDFCRMTLMELTSMMDRVIREDRKDPASYKPIVAIGHTKDLIDPRTVDAFLFFLREKGVAISTFEGIHPKLFQKETQSALC
jgi:hypothetical protein